MPVTIIKEPNVCISAVFAVETLNQNPAAATTFTAKRALLKKGWQAVTLGENAWQTISAVFAVCLLILIRKQANHTAVAQRVQKATESIKESTQEERQNNPKLLTVPNRIVKSLPKVLTKESGKNEQI